MDFYKYSAILLKQDEYEDTVNGHTMNPVAESEIDGICRKAIQVGVKVILTDPDGNETHQLIIDKPGELKKVPLT